MTLRIKIVTFGIKVDDAHNQNGGTQNQNGDTQNQNGNTQNQNVQNQNVQNQNQNVYKIIIPRININIT